MRAQACFVMNHFAELCDEDSSCIMKNSNLCFLEFLLLCLEK